jgi:hypothetical protein
MIVHIQSPICKILLSNRMKWAWGFWWIESARVGQNYDGFVRIGFKRPKINRTNWI